jgi:hypothetical protein
LSEIRATTISDAAGTGPITLTGQSAAKAWVNFDHATPVVRQSFNVSSVTDNTTGHFTKNYTNSMAYNDYVVSSSGSETGGTGPASDRFVGMARGPSRLLATASQFWSGDYLSPGTGRDQNVCVVSTHGDLA